jgi:hypothetical protein
MSEPVVQVTDLGVVDPMRLPPVFSRVPRWFRGLRAVAKGFLVLAMVDAMDLGVGGIGNRRSRRSQ